MDTETRNKVKDLYYQIKIFEKSQRPYISNFLNPAVQKYVKSILKNMGITDYTFNGGSLNCERKVLFLGKTYKDGFNVIRIEGIDTSVSHRDILGAIINLGIDRDKIGDIVFNNEIVEFAILEESKDTVLYSMTRVKNISVSPESKDNNLLQNSSVIDKSYKGTVASMRLDCIIAELNKMARTKAQTLIKQGKIKVNHIEERKVDLIIDEDDVISVSGTGRFVIKSIGNLTRKNRVSIEYVKKG